MATGDIAFRVDAAIVADCSTGVGGYTDITAWRAFMRAGTEQNPYITQVTVEHQYPSPDPANMPVPFDPRKRYNIIFQEV